MRRLTLGVGGLLSLSALALCMCIDPPGILEAGKLAGVIAPIVDHGENGHPIASSGVHGHTAQTKNDC